MSVYKNTIGNTSIINLTELSLNPKVQIRAKLESENPSGSIKDRPAFYMLWQALKLGRINKNTKIIEPTSGNTGIALAKLLDHLKIGFVAVMPESASPERRKLLKQYNAEIVLTDSRKGVNHSIRVAKQIIKEKANYLMLNQYENSENVRAHYKTTGREIIRQVPGITHFVAGMGTGGTLMGVSKRLKQFKKSVQIIGLEPTGRTKIQGLRNMKEYMPGIFSFAGLDKVFTIDDEQGLAYHKKLVDIGVNVGLSSGANLWGSVSLSKKIDSGVVVTVFPDSINRYI